MALLRLLLVVAVAMAAVAAQDSKTVPAPTPSSSSSKAAPEPSTAAAPASSDIPPSSPSSSSSAPPVPVSSSSAPEPSTAPVPPASSSSAPFSSAAPQPTHTPTPKPPHTTTKPSHTSTTHKPDPSDELHAVSSAIVAGGWIPFVVVMCISIVFSWSFVRYYRHPRESEIGTTIVAVLAMIVSIVTTSLIPVDVYLVSALKKGNGEFEGWGLDNHALISDTMQYAYYAMYALCVTFVFLIIPLAYFFFEEKDEEERPSCCKRFLNALKYTLALLIVMAILMLIGAFVLHSDGSACPPQQNGTDPGDWVKCRAEFAEGALTSDGGANAISFTVGFLAVVGVLYFVFYTGVGMVAMPVDMIRSPRADREGRVQADDELEANRASQRALESKYADNKKKMSSSDRRKMNKYRARERVLSRAVHRADEITEGMCARINRFLRPFKFVFGFIFILLSLFLVISLGISAADKLLQITSNDHLDWKTGYTEAATRTPNPVDLCLSAFQKAFPVDYIVVVLLMYYILLTTIAGVRKLGVRYCGFKLFNIRPQRTRAQALLFLCTIVMFTLLFVNIVMLTLAPQYITYGTQKYSSVPDYNKEDQCFPNKTFPASATQCDSDAPRYVYFVRDLTRNKTFQISSGGYFNDTKPNNCALNSLALCAEKEGGPPTIIDLSPGKAVCERQIACISTRVAALLNAFFYNLWFFGAIYYWANWGFILIFSMAFVYFTCSKKQSLVQRIMRDAKDDWDEDEDDDMTPFNPSWAR